MVRKFTKWDVLIPFLDSYNKSLILADFERQLDKPHQTVKSYIRDLMDDKVIVENSGNTHTSYRLNLRNAMTFDHLSIAEKMRTVDFLGERRMMRRLYEKTSSFFHRFFVALFGSYAVNREGNDIDLFVVGREDEELERKVEEFGE
ncbi:MAG: nucleotidyltransferase domain-containing protein, partial [Candidatus Aenigmatarchaeota archaeon]